MNGRLSCAHITGLLVLPMAGLLAFFHPGAAALVLGLYVLVCLVAPVVPGFGFYLPIFTHGARRERRVALTFDDGPDPATTPEVLALLARHGLRATFFLIGVKAQAHPELVKAILDGGHGVGNHSLHHDLFLMLKGRAVLRREIEGAQAVFGDLGIRPRFFRPPVGITNPHLGPLLEANGLCCVNFSCRARDMGNRRIHRLSGRLLDRVRPGDIVLLHDVAPPGATVEALLAEFEALARGLAERRMEVVGLEEMLDRN